LRSENGASVTAKIIAAATVLLRGRVADLDQAAELCAQLLSTSFRDRLLLHAAKNPWLAWICWGLERLTLPGIILHYHRRKCTIERLVRQHLQTLDAHKTESFGNVIANDDCVYVLGAGFDTLALRIAPLFPSVRFVEIDHPATQAVKRKALAATVLPGNLSFTSCDLATAEASALFPSRGNRLVIAEGLLMYFPVHQVKRLLATALAPDASDPGHASFPLVRLPRQTMQRVCVFTYMEQPDHLPAGFRPRSRIIDRWLAWKAEPFLWSAKRQQLQALIEDVGGTIQQHTSAIQMDGPESTHRLQGENLVLITGKKSV
jgi:hypothetical protein